MSGPTQPPLAEVLRSAARLQRVVPDVVLVGGSAAALHAGHRESFAPRDPVVIDEPHRYQGLDERWHDWADLTAVCHQLALHLGGATG